MSDEPKLPDNFEDAERFQRLFVQPLIQTVKTEMQSHAEAVQKTVDGFATKVSEHDKRLGTLEANQKKGMVGWGVLTLIVGTLVTTCWNWVKGKLHWT